MTSSKQSVPPWRTIRTTKELTLERVAGDAGIDPAHLSRIERGMAQPTLPVLYRMARALGLGPLERSLRPYVEGES